MIIKVADDKFPRVARLQALLDTGRIPTDKAAQVEQTIRKLNSGIKGENESAYLLDFYLRDSKRSMVIHDLRLELPDGRVAQIDHLLIHQSYRFYVLESKNFRHGVKITDEGEFLRWNEWRKNYDGIPSPVAQNDRHALILSTLLEKIGLPKPTIKSMVLIAPTARIDRSKVFDSSMVVKADQFLEAFEKDLNQASVLNVLSGFAKAIWNGSVEEIAKKLVDFHRPAEIDDLKCLGITLNSPAPVSVLTSGLESQVEPASHILKEFSVRANRNSMEATTVALSSSNNDGSPKCRSCDSANLRIEYGKSYYFKCQNCNGNTPIKLTCPICGERSRVRKDKLNYYRDCERCKTSELYYTNRVVVALHPPA